jgi:mannose-6-phosphate isomerase-like protein (cupin superfamily)
MNNSDGEHAAFGLLRKFYSSKEKVMRYNYYNRYSNNNRTEADISRLKTPNMYIPAKRNTQTGRSGYDNNPDQNNQRMQNDINMRTPQNEREMNQPEDHGPEPFVTDIERETIQNNNFIVALWTGEKLQITLMSLLPRGDIGLEIHPETDQFLRIEEGYGIVEMGDDRDNLDFQRRVADGDIVVIPAGKWHNLTNIGQGPLKLYSVYAPPEHPAGTVYRSRAEEELQRFNQQNQNQTRQPQNQAQPPQEQPPMTPVRPQAPMTPQVPMTPQPPMTPQEQPRMTPQSPMTPQAPTRPGGPGVSQPQVFPPGFQQMPLPEQVQPRAPITPPGQFPQMTPQFPIIPQEPTPPAPMTPLSPRTPQPSQPLPQTNQFRQPNPAPNQFVQPSHQTIRHGQTAPMPDNFRKPLRK